MMTLRDSRQRLQTAQGKYNKDPSEVFLEMPWLW